MFRQRDLLGTPINLLLSPQKCQGVPFSPIRQKSLLLQRPHQCRPHASATKRRPSPTIYLSLYLSIYLSIYLSTKRCIAALASAWRGVRQSVASLPGVFFVCCGPIHNISLYNLNIVLDMPISICFYVLLLGCFAGIFFGLLRPDPQSYTSKGI